MSKPPTPRPPAPTSPVISIPSRDIRESTKIQLLVRAGGRCEFRGHNAYLLEHPITHRQGLFAQLAHIVAFSVRGPRGNASPRPDKINDAANLMLLCPTCHIEIDHNALTYPRAELERQKREHEDRIRHLTGLGPELQTTIVQLKANIGGKAVAIPANHVAEAVLPRFPEDSRGCIVDLTNIHAQGAAFLAAARQTIDSDLQPLNAERMQGQKPRHISVFALAPIPALMYFGSRLSDKLAIDLFQFHRDTKDWRWKDDGPLVRYTLRSVRDGLDRSKVALMLSLSGTIDPASLPDSITSDFTVYEITLEGQVPSPGFLRRREDLRAFRDTYELALSTIVQKHGALEALHLFPAVPAPVAISCGHEPLHKAHPALEVYDFDRAQGGFTHHLRVN